MWGLEIIVVEDEIKSREGIIRLINSIDQTHKVVAEADNGYDGLKYVETLKPDLIICDIRMPKMDGLDMVYQLQKKGIHTKTVIITGHAEFEYAKKGIYLGVEDYLLKPITYDDMRKVLDKIKRKLDNEKKEKFRKEYMKKRIFESLLLGDDIDQIEMQTLSSSSSLMRNKRNVALSLIYTGDIEISESIKIERSISKFLKNLKGLQYYTTRLNSFNGIVFIVSCDQDFSQIADNIKWNLIPHLESLAERKVVFAWTKVDDLSKLNYKFEETKESLKWSLALGYNSVITPSKLANIKLKKLKYPYEIEKSMLIHIRNNDTTSLNYCLEVFLSYYKSEYYSPDQIIEVFHRLAFAILNFIKEIDYNMFKYITKKDILQSIKTSVTRYELEENFSSLINYIDEFYLKQKNNPVYSLLVRKSINFIEENYFNKIQLSDIADQLNVTQEYLSYLFSKEVGQNFTTFLKEYRVNKAKELLIETDLKIYEIAERVGYSDTKYFCRVFKEVTGFPTGEYIKVYHRRN